LPSHRAAGTDERTIVTDIHTDTDDSLDSVESDEALGSAESEKAVEAVEAIGDAGTRDSGEAGPDDDNGLLVREGDIAADYLERLLDIVDYDGDIDLDVENDRAVVAIVGGDLRPLIGPRGEVLDALQELTRLAVQQQTGVRSRLMLDISGHRADRKRELASLAGETASRVLASGEPVRLSPMNPFERKVVHDAIAAIDGVTSESEGEEPHRRVVVLREK
jgi:spoIIIJ-associated protein